MWKLIDWKLIQEDANITWLTVIPVVVLGSEEQFSNK